MTDVNGFAYVRDNDIQLAQAKDKIYFINKDQEFDRPYVSLDLT
jgi:hypothetical protein